MKSSSSELKASGSSSSSLQDIKEPGLRPLEVDCPAKITDMHVQTRHISTRAGSKTAWEKLAVYEKEFRLGHLCCKLRCLTPQGLQDEVGRANDRRDAAKAFDEGWAICNASWPSGSDLNRVRVVGTPGSFVDHQRETKDFWRRVEQRMSVNDWMICRRVCGEGYTVAKTVVSIQPGYKDSTLARFREALDALILAMGRARA